MEDTIVQDNVAPVADIVEDNNPSVSVENTEMESSMSVTVNAADIEQETEAPEPLEMPEKFANAEDPQAALLKAYKELEAFKSKPEAEPEVEPVAAEVESDEVVPLDIPPAAGDGESTVVTTAQDTWAKQGGQLTDDQWTNIQKETGVPMDTLRAWEAHVKDNIVTEAQTNDQKIFTAAGGEEKYDKMIEWANTSLTDDQISSLNAQLDNPQFSDMGVSALKGMYVNAVGFEPSIDPVSANTATGLDSGEFMNEAEFQEGMNHKDYGKGTRYDAEFDKKALRYMKRTNQL